MVCETMGIFWVLAKWILLQGVRNVELDHMLDNEHVQITAIPLDPYPQGSELSILILATKLSVHIPFDLQGHHRLYRHHY